ncbi:hypothetical protein [Streptomyces sp. NPDC051636]|uniref:hypothetical protein n=1 Tax=Streptomyces sp. NPDC051636 TaxID=3365663 RepID=UPI00379B1C0D
MTEPTEQCTAYIVNEHSGGTHRCIREAGHTGGEWGEDHCGPVDDRGVRYCWGDNAIGAVPHKPDDPAVSSAGPAPATDRNTLREQVVAAIKASPFEELRSVDHAPNGPLQITVKVDDLADVLVRRLTDAVLPAPTDQTAVLRDAADRIDATRAPFPIAVQNGITWATAELRRLAGEAQQDETRRCVCGEPETPSTVHRTDGPCYASEAQQEPCGRPSAIPTPCSAGDWCCEGPREAQQDPTQDGRTTLPCNWARTQQPHAQHNWEPQPGMDPVHCPGHPVKQPPMDPVHILGIGADAAVARPGQPETHSCRNCEGIDPDTCLMNPDRPRVIRSGQPETDT